eukprot:1161726-Pelagomonas_calceolata.AAC.10
MLSQFTPLTRCSCSANYAAGKIFPAPYVPRMLCLTALQWFLDGGLLPKLLGLLDAVPHGLAQQQAAQDGANAAQSSSEQQQGASHVENGGKRQNDDELCAALQVKVGQHEAEENANQRGPK